ncbi:MAG: hypothetical protein SH847_00935 [Roseiflexaceae bacterium]|nr:hypothetical protein [Roseiflexaceae bacterium]
MSYHITATYTLVVCDLCGVRGPAGHRDWRRMRDDAQDAPIHLCPHCRPRALWCEIHSRYHRPDGQHRCTCVGCGGLFTTNVRSQIVYCPSCLREQANASQTHHQLPYRGFVSRLYAMVRHR